MNIDDIPIVATKAKTFEELLEEKMQNEVEIHGQGFDGDRPATEEQKPKREFLRRK